MTKVCLRFVQKVSLKNRITNIGKFILKQKLYKITLQDTSIYKFKELRFMCKNTRKPELKEF